MHSRHQRRAPLSHGWNVAWLVFAFALAPAAANGQGSISGCVTDKSGAVFPGAEVIASGSSTQQRAVTDSSGCYRLAGLPAGTYSITASLVGFVTTKREGIALRDGQLVSPLDFALCLAPLWEVDWPVPGSLGAAWKQAAIVAYVRIVATNPVRSECPTNDVLHTADVIESLKSGAETQARRQLVFRQENWVSERTPYRIGQQMIVFLVGSKQELWRLAGPYYAFLITGDQVVSFHSPVSTASMTTADFLSTLRAMGRER
ncbi:MAG: carboxypeptidase-like regulatory domain-containing protein [Acidobacteria bacterium]|nr:carboxypeptidase-like regulatory domain-containing protein [Acidobacteriota bacterium]